MKIGNAMKEGIERRGYAFIPYIMGGFPDISLFKHYLSILDDYGDVIEIGLPYSDPIADGKTIQEANSIVLKNGYSLDKILGSLDGTKKPLVVMTYYNRIFRIGEGSFCEKLKEYNISGLIVPDLPVEYSMNLKRFCRERGIENIFLIAPNTKEKRENRIIKNSGSFIYLVQRYGVTGESSVYEPIRITIERIKKKTKKYLAVGFGISSSDHVKSIVSMGAYGIIVGSHIIRLILENKDIEKDLEEILSWKKN